MTDALPRMTIKQMSEALSIERYVTDWGHGGEMRGFMGDLPKEPSSPIERGAILAYDVAAEGKPSDMHALRSTIGPAIRIALAESQREGAPERSDVDHARLILTSLAVVSAMRDRSDGMEPSENENPIIEAMRRKSGVEASSFDPSDAHAIGSGMPDMVKGEEGRRQLAWAIADSLIPDRDDAVEDRLRMASATWPEVRPRDAVEPVSAAKGGSREGEGHVVDSARMRSDLGR